MGCVVVSVDGMCRFNFPNGNNLKQQWSHIGVFICYQNINARKKQNKKQKISVRQNNCLLDFSNFKIFVKFSAYEHGLNCGLDFRAEICKTFF